ncbi:MAG: tetratricopeptide repeat protein [candidate division KSB1 bacterium]|nr:tetratricopeptide repeat protein [candidate division KSB1 bacterium]
MKKAFALFGVMTICAGIVLVNCGQKVKVTEEQLYAKVLDFQNKQQWQDVAASYETLIKSFPKSAKADEYLYNLGMVYANNLKEYRKAVEAWKKLVKQHPNSRLVINTKFMIGYCLANDIKDLPKAKEAYEQFLKEYPEHELAPSVRWELDHLGQDISQIDLKLGEEEVAATK